MLEQAALDAVQKSGFHSLSFRTLASEVGVKSSSVHYYFPEKSHLASALIEKYSENLREKLADIDSRHRKPTAKLDAFVAIFEDVIKAKKFCLCGMMAAELATLDDRSRLLLSHYFRTAEDWLCAVFEQNASQINSGMTPRVLAQVILSGLEGAILLDRVDAGQQRLDAQREMIRNLLA